MSANIMIDGTCTLDPLIAQKCSSLVLYAEVMDSLLRYSHAYMYMHVRQEVRRVRVVERCTHTCACTLCSERYLVSESRQRIHDNLSLLLNIEVC